ncbi:major tail protein [Brevibacillus borstelensis]|uniref:major tail protein n=1 Tax=Brevibacillus borstelensis TaxID=45462 RepID=UPI0030BE1A7A
MAKGKGVRVGLNDVHYAIMKDDETYEIPKKLAGAIQAKISPKSNKETLYADDQAYEVATSLGDIELELNVADIPSEVLRDLLGHTINADGVLIKSSEDNAPYVALGFRSKKSNGKYRYTWIYKGKFQPEDQEFATKEDKPKFQTPTISGTFLPREDNKRWQAQVDEDDTGVKQEVIDNWFKAVYEETPPTP